MYPYGFTSADFEFVMVAVIVLCGLVLFAMLLFYVGCYILSSLGVYTIAKRRGIRHPWLAWFPYSNMWILGSISDQYQYVVKGRIKNRRKVLLAVMIAMAALTVPITAFEIMFALGLNVAMVLVVLTCLVLAALAIVGSVFQYMAYYDLFRSCLPENATVFLVLGILFQVTLPFFLFACRKHEKGMPPRKPVITERVIVEAEPNSVEETPASVETESVASAQDESSL